MAVSANLTKVLIQELKKRPMIWDRNHDDYSNIQMMNREWNKLAAILGKDKDLLKTRWRRCRDVFRCELKKLQVPKNPKHPLMSYYRGVWPHFEDMLFLRDTLTSRKRRLPDDVETDQSQPDSFDVIQIEKEEMILPEMNCPVTDETSGSDWGEMARSQAEVAMNWANDEFDEDVNFAKSIVTYLRRLNPVRKLMVRNEIQSILLREMLCHRCNGAEQNTCGNCK